MIKFSVKKPMTVFVVVIAIIALGIVSILGMTPDLLPSLDLPYMVVMTTYPGATPGEVEVTVTKPLEQTLSTLEDIKTITSTSAANYSLVIMEFENGASMDTAMVSTLQSIDSIEGYWPDTVGSPYIMKINPNMIPITVAACDMDGYDVEQLTALLNDSLMNKLEGTTGVASISTGGAIESQLNVKISEEKIDALNDRMISKINSGISGTRSQIKDGISQLNSAISQMDSALTSLNAAREQAVSSFAQVPEAMPGYAEMKAQYEAGLAEIDSQIATVQQNRFAMVSQRSSLESTLYQVNQQAENAIKQVNFGQMISVDMISGILQAQNFSMPAGYVQEGAAQYLVSVGDKLTSVDDARDLLLFNVEGIGDVRLDDVADIFMSDNSGEVYASINGNPGLLLTFSKQSNYATAKVSNNIQAKFKALEEEYPGLHFTVLMDQGDYIYLIIGAITESLIFGAIFAVLVLFLFLRDIKPTFITLLSIPISLLLAIAAMYFTGVTINMISLSGLAVSVGMLVDNSIVVIENIFRMRRLGIDAKKAAIAGAKEVAGAIIASTLTTVCVFAPIVFTEGITRQLFTDMALTITYSLCASLFIALTLVPALSSRMLSKVKKESLGFVSFKNLYRRFLNWNLNHKALILLIAIGLLVYSVSASLSKGFIFIPDMSTPQMSGTLTMNDEDATLEDTRAACDEALARMGEVEGVETVGGMLSSTGMGLITGQTDVTSVSLYIIVDQEAKATGKEIAENCAKVCEDLPCKIDILSSSSITEYTAALGGSGVGIKLYSTDQEKLYDAAKTTAEALSSVDGIVSVNDGMDEATPELHFTVNKDKAMAKGLTVAQVYMVVAEAMSKTSNPTTLNMNGQSYEITVAEAGDSMLSLADLKALEIEYKTASGAEGTVKLADICDMEETESLPSIARYNQRNYMSVSAEISDDSNVTLVTTECEKVMKDVELPAGVSYEFDGENEMIMDAIYDLLKMMGLGILLVYLIMVAQFQSLKSPFIVMFTIPLAFTGGLLALLIFHKEISIVAMIGLILLVGVIVNNGIVLVDYINQLRARGLTKRQAIVEAGATRMRPVMMTSLTTILGLIIMATGKTAGTDMMQPIALVCIGGLVYATLLTLLVVPAIYDIFNGEEFKAVKKEDLDITGLIAE